MQTNGLQWQMRFAHVTKHHGRRGEGEGFGMTDGPGIAEVEVEVEMRRAEQEGGVKGG